LVKYSLRAKYLGANPGNICYFQGTRETKAESLLINCSDGILRETISGVTEDTTKVVSEDEGNIVSIEDIVCLEGAFSKGIAKRGYPYSILNVKTKYSLYIQLLSLPKNRIEKDCAVYFQDLDWNTKKQIDTNLC